MAKFPAATSSDYFPAQWTGQTGNMTNVWQASDVDLTRPNNATAYAANNLVGSASNAIFKFTDFFRSPGSSGILTGLRCIASVASIATANMGAITAHLFNAAPTGLVPNADQGIWETLLADDLAKLGTAAFSTWTIGGTGSNLIESYATSNVPNLGGLIPLIGATPSAASGRDLYAVLVATGAFTPIASSITRLYASAQLD